MLRFYSQFPFVEQTTVLWMPDLINSSGVFLERVLSSGKFPYQMHRPLGLAESLLCERLDLAALEFVDCDFNKKQIWQQDFFKGFPNFCAGLSKTQFLSNGNVEWKTDQVTDPIINQWLTQWFEFYFHSLDLRNGTLENLIGLALKMQSELSQGGEEFRELLERLRWDFLVLVILARDVGADHSSKEHWQLNPTSQIVHNHVWKEKKGIFVLWADGQWVIHNELISGEEAEIFRFFEEGVYLNKNQHRTSIFQKLAASGVLL